MISNTKKCNIIIFNCFQKILAAFEKRPVKKGETFCEIKIKIHMQVHESTDSSLKTVRKPMWQYSLNTCGEQLPILACKQLSLKGIVHQKLKSHLITTPPIIVLEFHRRKKSTHLPHLLWQRTLLNEKTKKTQQKENITFLHMPCGVLIQASGRLCGLICLNAATLTPCFQPKYLLEPPRDLRVHVTLVSMLTC